MKKEKKKIIYRDIECDSDEEKYFLMWAFELKEAGYISKIERAPSFKLTDGWVNEYEEQLKTKSKIKKQTILQDSEYTPDVLLTLTKKGSKLCWQKPFYGTNKRDKLFVGTNCNRVSLATGGPYTGPTTTTYFGGCKTDWSFEESLLDQVLIEVKSSVYDHQNMTRVFGLNQKFLYYRYKIYTNLVKIPDFFKATWVPKEYLKTDISGKDRKINFSYVLIEEYLKNLEK